MLSNVATITSCQKLVKELLLSLLMALIAAGGISYEIHEGIGLEGKELAAMIKNVQ